MDSPLENSKKSGLSPLRIFKSAVLTVIANLPWLNDKEFPFNRINMSSSREEESFIESDKISVFHKLILFKPSNQRTRVELESIKWMFVGFKCFRLCSIEVQTALVGRALYKCYGPGRWILKEGHSAEHMYLIVKGRARVTERVYNVVFKTTNTVERCQLAEKQSFGESAVMFNTRRITSVQSSSTLELISISKDDFMDVIKDNLQVQWDMNAEAIQNSPYFKHLNEEELNKCKTISFIKTFKKNEYVFGRGLGVLNCGHFVVEGQISMMYRLAFTKNIDRYGTTVNTLLENVTDNDESKKNFLDEYVNTCTFSSGSCFNVGEDMADKEFMNFDDVNAKCLCVPHWFMAKTEKLKHWTFVRLDLGNIIPDKGTVFKRFLAGEQRPQ